MGIHDRVHARRDLDQLREVRDLDGLAAALNAEGLTVPRQRFVTARAVMASCTGGIEILAALEAARTHPVAGPAVSWALTFLGQEAGLDIGDPFTQAMIANLVELELLSEAQGIALKALALQPLIVDRLQVESALYHPDGTEK